MQLVGRTWLNFVTWTCWSWSECQHDLYFTVQWFFLYLEDYLMYVHHTLGVWISMPRCLTSTLMKVTVTYTPWSSDFALYLEDYLMDEQYYLRLWVSDRKFDLKINIGHYDLYFTVQWFCLKSLRLFDVCTSYFRSIKSARPDVWPKS